MIFYMYVYVHVIGLHIFMYMTNLFARKSGYCIRIYCSRVSGVDHLADSCFLSTLAVTRNIIQMNI